MNCTYEKAAPKDRLAAVLSDPKVSVADDGICQEKENTSSYSPSFLYLNSTSGYTEERKWKESSFSLGIYILAILVFTMGK